MSLLLFALVVAGLAAGWVIHPIIARRYRLLVDPLPASVLDREVRKRVTLASLKDAEYDRATGKLDDADYRDLKLKLEKEALEALQAVEADRAREAAPVGAGAKRKEGAVVHSCGRSNPAGSRFCAQCGERLA